MKTTLQFVSNHPCDDINENALLKSFIQHITGQEPSIDMVKNEVYNTQTLVFDVIFDSTSDLKTSLSKLHEHKLYPIERYSDVRSVDFSVNLINNNIDEMLQYKLKNDFSCIEDQINIIDHICSDIVSEQEELKDKVDALYSFFDKSGILYYKQIIQGLLDVMDSRGLINKADLEQKMFKNVH